MKNIYSLNKNRIIFICILAAVFCLMLILNSFTLYCCDDYEYKYSFATGERISSLKDIIPSMKAHAYTMNGRLFAHSLVQLFDMLPKAVFNVANSAMFTLLIFMIFRLTYSKTVNCLLLVSAFCMIWLFTPAFGQVFLWLDGSVNYLWGAVFCLSFLSIYIRAFLYGKYIQKKFLKPLLFVYAFFVGGYLENTAVATIVCAALLCLLCIFYRKDKIHFEYLIAIGCLIAGMLFMITRPGEAYKGAASFDRYYLNVEYILNICKLLFVPFLSYICMNILAAFSAKGNMDIKRILLAFVLFIGSVCANFVMIFSRVYPERCALIVAVLLITANIIMFSLTVKTEYKAFAACAAAALIIVSAYSGIYGCKDVVRTYEIMKANEKILSEAHGTEETIVIPVVHAETKYSSSSGLVYLGEDSASDWPNMFVARYYDLGGVIGSDDPDSEAAIMYDKVFNR